MLCTDIGGTSFDIALITDGGFEVTATPDIARFVLNTPLVKIDSIGAGTGSFVRVNPNSNRPELGPDSAGARVGVCWPEGGLETISVTDLNLVLGRLNPDYFLGGDLDLDIERAEHAVATQLAGPLGLSVPDAAAGVIDLFEQTLRHEAVGRILGKGYSPGRLRAALLRRRRPAARRRLHRRAFPTATCSCPRGRRASAPTAAPARTSSTASSRRSTCRSSRTPTPT